MCPVDHVIREHILSASSAILLASSRVLHSQAPDKLGSVCHSPTAAVLVCVLNSFACSKYSNELGLFMIRGVQECGQRVWMLMENVITVCCGFPFNDYYPKRQSKYRYAVYDE